jgi:hypothetical protein
MNNQLSLCNGRANGWRYLQVGEMMQHYFDGISLKPCKVLKNAATPTCQVHAVLGGGFGLLDNLPMVS